MVRLKNLSKDKNIKYVQLNHNILIKKYIFEGNYAHFRLKGAT